MAATAAKNVANYFLSLQDENSGDLISNLKLQKLLYYAQGFHLAIFDEALFSEAIKAWEHGPVVPDVWHAFRDSGSNAIPAPVHFDPSRDFSSSQIEVMRAVYETYGQFSAWKLRNLTHDEPPWRNAGRNEEISHGALIEYFKTQLT